MLLTVFPSMQDVCLCAEQGGAFGHHTFIKLFGRWSFSSSCPAGRKIKAFFLDLSMPTHVLAWLLLASGKQTCFPVQVPLALDMAQVPSSSSRETSCSLSTFLYSRASCHARVAGRGQSLLDSTLYCKEKLLPAATTLSWFSLTLSY